MRKVNQMLVVAAASLVVATGSQAATTWVGNVSSDMNTLSNWSPAPTSSTNLYNDDMTVTAVVGPNVAPVAAANFNVGTSGGDNNGSLTIRDGGNVTWSGRFNTIGNSAFGTVTITNGTLLVNYTGVESHAFNLRNGLMHQKVGSSLTWSNGQDTLYVGRFGGNGTWQMDNGVASGINLVLAADSASSVGTFDYNGLGSVALSGSIDGNAGGTGTFDFDLSGTGHTIFTVANNVDLLSTTIKVTGVANPGASFTLFSIGGVLSHDLTTTVLADPDWTVSFTGGDGNDVVATYIPEPATLGLLSIGLLCLLRARR